MRYSWVVSLVVLASCAQPAAIPEDDLRARYDFSEFHYEYARAVALPRTNLEPAPTSYVLFAQPRLDVEGGEVVNAGFLAELEERRRVHEERMKRYCLELLNSIKDVPSMRSSDPFGNLITFYWPVGGKEADLREALKGRDPDSECDFLAKNYDFDRAEGLLSSLDDGVFFAKAVPGPVMVLDLGFDAVAVSYDFLETEELSRAPDAWIVAINRTLSEAFDSRLRYADDVRELDETIGTLERDLKNNLTKKARKEASDRLREAKAAKRGLLARWFSKGSWGRAILCGFSKAILSSTSYTEPVQAKLDRWCAPPASEPEKTARATDRALEDEGEGLMRAERDGEIGGATPTASTPPIPSSRRGSVPRVISRVSIVAAVEAGVLDIPNGAGSP